MGLELQMKLSLMSMQNPCPQIKSDPVIFHTHTFFSRQTFRLKLHETLEGYQLVSTPSLPNNRF